MRGITRGWWVLAVPGMAALLKITAFKPSRRETSIILRKPGPGADARRKNALARFCTSVTFSASAARVYHLYGMASTQPSLRAGSRPAAKSATERSNFRRWQRQRLNMPVRLIVSREDSTRITEGRVNDISEGGLLIFAGVELRGGERLAVEFTLPYSSTPVRAPGIVRHRRGYHYGVEFDCESRADQEQAEKFRNLLQLAAGNAT